jgi:hypothetical protein
MKKIIIPLSLYAVFGLSSCSEDFEVSAPHKDYTVVYGILNASDTAHYIRIQKAFLDENKSAIDLAKLPDSSYYSNLNVTIQPFDANNTPQGNPITLTKVDMTAEGYPKNAPANEQGFFTTPSYAYKFKAQLNSSYKYKITINNPASGATHTADVSIVNNDPDPNQSNSGFYVSSFNKDTVQLAFERTLPAAKLSISGNVPRNGAYFEGFLRFQYLEKNATTGAETRKSVDYMLSNVENKGANFILSTPNTSIYNFLRDEIGIAPNNIQRYMGFVEIHLFAGNQELALYKQLNNTQGGLTGDQIKPIYTNIKGPDAIGVIASKAERVHYQGFISSNTLDSLQRNPITEPLRILGRTN